MQAGGTLDIGSFCLTSLCLLSLAIEPTFMWEKPRHLSAALSHQNTLVLRDRKEVHLFATSLKLLGR